MAVMLKVLIGFAGTSHQHSLLIPQDGWTKLTPSPLLLSTLLNAPADDALFQGSAFYSAAITAAIGLVGRMATSLSHLPGFPELFNQALTTLQKLSHNSHLPQVHPPDA